MNTEQLGPFLGVNNRKPDYALHVDKEGDFVRSAVDVDLDNAGQFVTRSAFSMVQALSDPHSLHMTDETHGYIVRNAVLYAITLPIYSETIVKTLASDAYVSWLEYGGSLYYSNNTDSGRIDNGVWHPIGLPTPDSPVVTATAGALYAGWYQVGLAWRNATTGESGGVGPSSNFELTTDGGLHIALPAAEVGATHIDIYVSGCNGSTPIFHSTYAAGTASANVTTSATGHEASQRFEAPLPAGHTLFEANGRLCSVSGQTIYVGLPYRPGYYLPAEGYIPFSANVSVAVPAQGGTYVAADKTYWIPGDIGNVTDKWVDVLPYGAVRGTAFISPNKTEYGWFGAKGFVIGKTSGEVEAVMSDNITVLPPAYGVSHVVEDAINRRVVSCGWAINLDSNGATSYTNYDFTSISGRYATKPDGVYDLLGTAEVFSSVGFGNIDFGVENIKHMKAIYVSVSSDGPVSAVVGTPNEGTYTYPARSSSLDIKLHRIDTGKGLRANYFDLTIEGVNFTMASVSFAPVATERRIAA